MNNAYSNGSGPRAAQTYAAAPPSHYVAGVGRGAMGFTTRSDIGPARPTGADPNFGQAPAGYVAGRGRGMGDLARGQGEMSRSQQQQEADRADYSESNYDEFSGYGEKLFTATEYGEDDREADMIYDKVDDMMESRRKRNRERQLLEQQKKAKNERPRIADQFADLKRDLSTVSASEWDAIPEVGDHSLKLKQSRKKETFVPVPDFIIEGAAALTSAGGGGGGATGLFRGGLETPAGLHRSAAGSGLESRIAGGLAEARGSALTSKLDMMSDSVSGQTVVDPKGYLTNLNSLKITSSAEVGDIKKARVLLSSVTSTNPKHGPGWIAAARVEEFAGKIAQARKVIIQGCETCPESEDVWLEAARLHPPATAKTILANAVIHLPTSVKIWLAAADLEESTPTAAETAGGNGSSGGGVSAANSAINRKKAVLRRSLEFVPNSVKLWKAAIELESIADARIMLARAVECVPQAVEMWLALAKLETHANARKVLNQARQAIPTERATWITAAKLEEAHGNGNLVPRIIEKMIVSLAQHEVIIDREDWLKEAEDCEHAGAVITCRAIVNNTVALGVEEEDRLRTWMDDAEAALSHKYPHAAPSVAASSSSAGAQAAGTQVPSMVASVHTARAIYDYALGVFPSRRSLWLAASMLEKEHGTAESLENRLKDGVKHCPHAEVLWLMAAKEKWVTENNIPAARDILVQAFKFNPKSEQIWLAAVKLEWENNEYIRARLLLSKAREQSPTERVWLKSSILEREMGEFGITDTGSREIGDATELKKIRLSRNQQALTLLDAAIKRYPTYAKFYMMAGQICDSVVSPNEPARARNYYMQGLKLCAHSVPLWRMLIQLEERVKGVIKARSTGELARMKMQQNELIWLECIRLERRAGNVKLADNLMAKALVQCSSGAAGGGEKKWPGVLLAEDILTCPKPSRKSKSLDALKKCNNDPVVIIAVARLFEEDGKIAKPRRWFERAVALAPRYGDAWAYYYLMETALLKRQRLLRSNGLIDSGGGRGGGEGERGDNVSSDNARGAPAVGQQMGGGIGAVGLGSRGATSSAEAKPAVASMDGVDDDDDDENDEEEGVELDQDLENGEEGDSGRDKLNGVHDGEAIPSSAGMTTATGAGTNTEKRISSASYHEGAATVTTTATAGVSGIVRQEKALRDLEQRCDLAQPNSGELWTAVSKEVGMRRKKPSEVLREIARRTLLDY